MSRDELRTRMADYLDGLLDESEAREVAREIGRHPDLLAEVARMRAILYQPWPVAPPAPDQPASILARHRDRPLVRVLRYAAVFLAGVLTTFLVRAQPAPPSEPSVHTPEPAPVRVVHRRIH